MLANIVKTERKSHRIVPENHPLKEIMKLSRRRMNLKAFDQVQFFKGGQTRLCTMGKACWTSY